MKLNNFINKRENGISQFKELSDIEFNHLDRWNVHEIAHHCYKIEKVVLESIKGFQKERSKITLKNYLNALILFLALRSNLKFKAPAKSVYPDKNIHLDNFIKDWENQGKEWIDLYHQFKSSPKAVIYFHPLAGKLNLNFTLRFIIHHLNHHCRQLRK